MGTILLLSGPNLNLLGDREPEIYGATTLDDLVDAARRRAKPHGFDVEHVQSNSEGGLIDAIHRARRTCDGIVINPGAFTHYAYAIGDALAAFDGPIVELHLSNTHRRESWRHTSVISPFATGVIMGFGAAGYELAIDALAACLAQGRK
jgi:3-dehydroquinate dehydratase II